MYWTGLALFSVSSSSPYPHSSSFAHLLEFRIVDMDVFKHGESTDDRLDAIEDVRQQSSRFVRDQVAKNEDEVSTSAAKDGDMEARDDRTTGKQNEEPATSLPEDDHDYIYIYIYRLYHHSGPRRDQGAGHVM